MPTVRELNDAFRSTFHGGKVMKTAGIDALDTTLQAVILLRVQTFDHWTADNDPYGEHDFGSVTVAGHEIFWKIDYYDKNIKYHSPNPSDPEQTTRVLTVMLSSEY